jgi:hypothetical protein
MPEVIYYQEQPLTVEYTKNKRRPKYHPDALVAFLDGTSVVVEVKQVTSLVDFKNLIKYDTMLRRCEAEGWGAFIGDDRASLRHLQSHTFDPRLLHVLRTRLKYRPISLDWLKTNKAHMNLTAQDVNAAFLQLGLVVESAPFLARQAEPEERALIQRVLRYFRFDEAASSGEEPPTTSSVSTPAGEAEPAARTTARRAAAHRTRALHSSALPAQYQNAYNPWTADEEQLLLAAFSNGATISDLARRLGRKPGAIRWRLKKLNV